MSSTGTWCQVSWSCDGDGTAVVAVDGEVDAATAQMLEAAIAEAVEAAGTLLVVDVGAVQFMDAAGLRVLVRSLDDVTRRGRQLRLERPSRPVLRLLSAAAMLDRFEITPESPATR
jgi:anti-sigma B factor antagonist